MNVDRWLMLIEVFLLLLVVVQGESIRFYERGVYRIHAEREKERREWREQKRKQAVKKSEASTTTPASIAGEQTQ